MSLQIGRKFNEADQLWEVILKGEVDISNAAQLKSELQAMLKEKMAPVTMDIKDLSYIDSTGLGVIIGTYKRMEERGISMKMKNPVKNVEKLLKITNLDRIFL